ncbi:MAG: hypothetical protein E6K70_21505 [Planctomycetota bacterium]|nr:MAG: hypothetical protein E6K70_21505 [Planctomycetota bacterium]
MASGQMRAVLEHLHKVVAPADAAAQSDRQLLARFAADHDQSAFTQLVRRHGALVLDVCWRVLRHAEDAEDAFQATFLVLARKATALRWQESVGSWLYAVAYRLTLKAPQVGRSHPFPRRPGWSCPLSWMRSCSACPRSSGRRCCSAASRAARATRQPSCSAGAWAS